MQKPILVAILTAVLGAGALAAQTSAPAQTGKDKEKDKTVPLVVTGCVASPQAGTFTVDDQKKGRFELTGHELDIYIGKRVELRGSGTSDKGLHITTGLSPSPNASAQAILDPVHAAQAALPGGADRTAAPQAMPRITVSQIKTVKGDCK